MTDAGLKKFDDSMIPLLDLKKIAQQKKGLVVLNTRIPEYLRDNLELIARRNGKSLQESVAAAIQDWIIKKAQEDEHIQMTMLNAAEEVPTVADEALLTCLVYDIEQILNQLDNPQLSPIWKEEKRRELVGFIKKLEKFSRQHKDTILTKKANEMLKRTVKYFEMEEF